MSITPTLRDGSVVRAQGCKKSAIVATILTVLASTVCTADELVFSYDGVDLPDDAGFSVFNECEEPCFASIQGGKFVLEWFDGMGDAVNFDVRVSQSPDPPPQSLWVEWRFRSDLPLPPGDSGCDSRAFVFYRDISDLVYLHGNAVVSFDGGLGIAGLHNNTFYTVRFESRDGSRYTFAVDGRVFVNRVDPPPSFPSSAVQFGGIGSCARGLQTMRTEWDFVRYGTISDGEVIVASDPPPGIVDATQHPALDRFTVSFDQPAFVYIDQIDVTTTSGDVPQVLWTKRLDNGPPSVVQVVLDRPLSLNATTTFTFDDGVATSVVEYTYVELGACCGPKGACVDGIEESNCAAEGGVFIVGESCGDAQACCFDGHCAELAPVCCTAQSGSSRGSASPLNKGGWALAQGGSLSCENDADGDGVDGVCGDQCPMDENKIAPGVCGCGVSDIDSDGDTIADCFDRCPDQDDLLDSDADTVPDCLDQCEGEDDRIDEDENGTPDCAQFQPIPTASTWGLATLALLLLIAAKLRSSVFPSRDRKGVVSIRHSKFAVRHSSSPLTKGGWASAQGGGCF